MKTLILLAFMLIANVFAGEGQEIFCGDKSLSYCINHFDRQCQAKNYSACSVVGELHAEQEQYSQAKKYYEMVCDKANSEDSYETEWIDGIVVKVSATMFMGTICHNLGIIYRVGLGVRQRHEKALQYYKKACDLGSGKSCTLVGSAYYDGEVVKKDLKSVIKFAAKACELKDGIGCGSLGQIYQYGIGVKQNYSKAKELYGKACDLGFQEGCDAYKELKEKGY